MEDPARTEPLTRPAGRSRRLLALIALQAVSAGYFALDVTSDLIPVPAMPDGLAHKLFELAAVLALILGSLALLGEFRRLRLRAARVEDQLRVASGAFAALMEERFEDWGLTPSERDVALMSIKGLSITEIAKVRGRAEGTVKAQLNAIYGKAGVSGRHQLLSLFIEDLMAEGLPGR